MVKLYKVGALLDEDIKYHESVDDKTTHCQEIMELKSRVQKFISDASPYSSD